MSSSVRTFLRFFKVLFASYAAAIGIGIITVLLGAILFGFERVDNVIENYSLYILGMLTVFVFPFMYRKLK